MAKITFKDIQTLAKNLKSHVEKKHALPASITIGKTKYTYPQIGYILAKSVNNIGKDITVIKVGKAQNKTGETVKFKVSKTDYKKLAKNYSEWIEKNKKLPNYSNYKNKKIKQRVMIYSLAKIIVWYTNNGKKLPATCRFYTSETVAPKKTTPTTKKKYGHATKNGCDNMGQNNGYYCGPHSLQECIRNLTGKVIKQSTLAAWAGTTHDGTDHPGLETALAKASKEIGVKLTCKWYNFSDLGWNGVKKIVNSDNQDCIIHNLYRNTWGHYETVNNVSDSNIKVQNSLGDSGCGSCYCGYVENRTPSTYRSYINGISQKSVMVITRG